MWCCPSALVGALSIVRFRTAIKEPLDIAFLFWSIAVGIVLAAGMIPLAVIGSVIIGVILLIFVNRKSHCNPYIIVVQCADHNSETKVKDFLTGQVQRCVVKSKSVQRGSIELNMKIRLKDDNTGFVNTPIDTPISSGSADDRPMLNWIFKSEEYTQLYHRYFAEFIEGVDFAEIIDATAEMIAPYVKKDPTAFYSYQEFESGIDTLRAFCLLREESVEGQINGTIPAITSGQAEDSSALIDASSITLSDMGSMGGSGEGGFKPNSDQSR